MRAARAEGGSVVVVDADTTEPGRDEVVVRIHTCGVCHSDLHLVKQDWSFAPPSGPIGHEAIGVVERLGPGADRFVSVGDRVILGLGGAGGGYWCGSCEFCVDGHPRLCAQARQVLGAMAETYTIWAPALVVLPDAVDDLEAPLACGGLTAYSAVRKLTTHDVGPGSVVAVLGAAGGLGHYAVQLASAFGHRVLAVDVGADRLAFARELGAEWAVEPDDAAATAAAIGGAHASLVFAASIAGYRLGFELLRKRGVFIGVGLPATDQGAFSVGPFELFSKDPTIVFSAVGTVQEMRELVDLAARGVVRSHIGRTGSLDEVGTVFEELAAGAYLGRAVIDLR